MANEVRINGNVLSWGSVICRINGTPQHWLTSISYSEKRERSVVYGMGRHHAPRGRTLGKYSVENPKIKGPMADATGFVESLASQADDGASYGDVRFDIALQFVEESSGQSVTIEIEDCRIVGLSDSAEEGADALQTEIEIHAMRLRRNGKTLFDATSV